MHEKKLERIRLGSGDPLVLKVSALSDFLWPEFLREAKPQVTYLVDRFNISQLSRFGKEVFEFLYKGGDVDPVVAFDDIEDYFRKKQNGESPAPPKNYKPENALWNQILFDITEHPAYRDVVMNCTGEHFNSGNLAVCVLNELSNVVQDMAEDSSALSAMTDQAQELSEIRSAFVQAMADGDTQKAAELRQQGKELGQKIEETLSDSHADFKPQINQSIEKAVDEAKDIEDAMASLAGDQKGVGTKLDNIDEKNALARKLRMNKRLLQFARRLGALKQTWNIRKRERPIKSQYSEIVGANLSNDVTKAFPAEIALAATEEGRMLFALKHSQRTLLTKDFEAKTKDAGRGPVVMYIDISGSMRGESEIWSKALAYVVSEECLKDNREVQIHLFDTAIERSLVLEPHVENQSLLDFIMQWHTHGGTSFNQVMKHAYKIAEIDPKADILLITDGHAEVDEAIVRKFNMFKEHKNIDVKAFCIDSDKYQSLEMFCDSIHPISPLEDAASSDVFLKAIA